MNRVVQFLALFAMALAPVEAAAPTNPLAVPKQEQVGAWMPITSASPLGIRLKRHFGLYTGIGVRVPLSTKANWYFQRYGVPRAVLGVGLALLGLPALAGYVIPAPKQSVWAGGLPREWVTINAKVKTATNLKAGLAVERDTTNNEIKIATSASAVVAGWLTERNWTQPDWDPTTAPAAADLVEVVMQVPGTIVKVRNDSNLTYGALLNVGATGQIAAAAVAAAGDIPKVVGKLLADSDGSGGQTDAIVVLGF